MRIPSGVTDQGIYFVAVDPTDFTTRETGLTTFTVYRSRNGEAPVAMTNPAVAEVSAPNLPGVYALLLNEDMTIDEGNDSEQMVFHITQASMADVTISIELYRPKITVGETLAVAGGGATAVNISTISGSSIAADNLEKMYDGTGYTDDTAPASRAQVGQLSSGSAAISTTANVDTTITTGIETQTYAATAQLDGSLHTVTSVGSAVEFYYEFSVGSGGVPVEFLWDGYARGNSKVFAIKAYNWGGTTWEQVGTVTGSNGTTVAPLAFQATNAHVGTGTDIGKVRLQITSADCTDFVTDRILCSYAVVSQSVGYAGGAVWVDTNGSNTGTADYIDGVADNPVNSWANALTVSASLGLTRFKLAPGSAITLSAASDSYEINASGSTITLNGQSVSGAHISSATIVGNDDGSNAIATLYDTCKLGNSTLGKHILDRCTLTGNITLAETSDYLWDQCTSFVASNGTPDVTFPTGVAVSLNIRHYSGGMEVNLMDSNHTMSFEADGQFKMAADCTGGAVSIRGCVGPITDEAGGVVTLTENARIADDTITTVVQTELATLNDVSTSQVKTQVVAALNTDTYTEPAQGAPAADTTLVAKIGMLYKTLINKKTSDASEIAVYNAAGTIVDQKRAVSDDGSTYEEDKFISGP